MTLDYIRFDVGHHLHVCHRTTIEKYPNSSLASYIKPEFDKRQTGSDYIVIDRDGRHFGTILNFMRDSRTLHLNEWTRNDITDLMIEADYYCLTELVEFCDQQLSEFDKVLKEERETQVCEDYKIPKNRKVEMIFSLNIMRELLESVQKRVIIASYRSIRKFHIDTWLQELVRYCDFTKLSFYCLADNTNFPVLLRDPNKRSTADFLLALYDPQEKRFIGEIPVPTEEKFRTRRYRYKARLLTFCFCADKKDFHELMPPYVLART